MSTNTSAGLVAPIHLAVISLLAMLMCTGLLQAEEVFTTVSGCPDANSGGNTVDLEVTTTCQVKAGTYTYRNVNIYNGGQLEFLDEEINFYVNNILVENHSKLTAGKPEHPIGESGHKLQIFLYGGEDGSSIQCKTDERCGVPEPIWTSNTAGPNDPVNPNSCKPVNEIIIDGKPATLPGNVKDCFYQYDSLPSIGKGVLLEKSYFGHKVIAVSYGGTLQLYGKKGATFGAGSEAECGANPSACSGSSWARLVGSLKPTDKALTLDRKVNWLAGDHIVVTTTDYLPGHSEELVITNNPVITGQSTHIEFRLATQADQNELSGCTTNIGRKSSTSASGSRVEAQSRPYRSRDGKVTTLARGRGGSGAPDSGVLYPHNGMTYPVPQEAIDKAGLTHNQVAETRAAVALLSRSIRIVSMGAQPNQCLEEKPGNYFGGHTIVRQGFETFQVQGVEFQLLGQGGKITRYPLHFHLARQTPQPATAGDPPVTFVMDSSVNESMTRWVTIHGTQGVTLARNVGYRSIGHGFYLEDGTETDNHLTANLGIFARAAIDNKQNPRQVPGILAAYGNAPQENNFPFQSDYDFPTAFWIMNGYNDFQHNMAAGVGSCGACYWLVPGANSGPSRKMWWAGYAGEQQVNADDVVGSPMRAGMAPLRNFTGNFCSTAMNAFQVNGNTTPCNGIRATSNPSDQYLPPVFNPQAPTPPPVGTKIPDDNYYPNASMGGGHFSTLCNDALPSKKCATVTRCADGVEENCDVTMVDQFTTSFNWAAKNYSAIWLRPFWSLLTDSVITDVQNAGVTFVTGGDYTKSSVITGYWGLARKNVFIGDTQFNQSGNLVAGNPFASNAGPFNPLSTTMDGVTVEGLKCKTGVQNLGNACLIRDEGISMQLEAFSTGQRLFSVYDGPAYQDSDVFLSIQPTNLSLSPKPQDPSKDCRPNPNNPNPCAQSGWMYGNLFGLRIDDRDTADRKCYLPNAGIGWKQPNAFFYAPAFHSRNLYFGEDVAIRHFVIEPLFEPGTLQPNLAEIQAKYCKWEPNMFTGFNSIDRMTVLNDDDGSLTGLVSKVKNQAATEPTLSINLDDFFKSPVQTPECASDLGLNPLKEPATADTSPYEHVTTVIFPSEDCHDGIVCEARPKPNPPTQPICNQLGQPAGCAPLVNPLPWSQTCSNENCYGVPLYRQLTIVGETKGPAQQIRMSGQANYQRSSLTTNHGIYYLDTTKSQTAQEISPKPGPGITYPWVDTGYNVFEKNKIYSLFFVYGKPTTRQTYQIYVGGNDDAYTAESKVAFTYAQVPGTFHFVPQATWPDKWVRNYDKATGMLTVTVDLSSELLKDGFDLTKNNLGEKLCQPKSMCTWGKPVGKTAETCHFNPDKKTDPRFKDMENDELDSICAWSVKEIDCPLVGCPGFQFAMANTFEADDQDHRPDTIAYAEANTDKNPIISSRFDWTSIAFGNVASNISGAACNYLTPPGQPSLYFSF